MKKLLLLIVFSLTLVMSSVAQQYKQVSKIEIGTWSTYVRKWIWESPVPTDMILKLSGSHVYISDQAKTHIVTYGPMEESSGYNNEGYYYNSNRWKSYDEKGRKCYFSINGIEELNLIIYAIMYDDVVFRYYCYQN